MAQGGTGLNIHILRTDTQNAQLGMSRFKPKLDFFCFLGPREQITQNARQTTLLRSSGTRATVPLCNPSVRIGGAMAADGPKAITEPEGNTHTRAVPAKYSDSSLDRREVIHWQPF